MPRGKSAFIALAVAGLVALPGAAAARTEPLTCGEQIDHDVTVANDLTCPPSAPPIAIVRSGVRLDLDGHELDRGFGTVLTAEGVNHVTIRNGSLFTQGRALVVSGWHDRLERLQGFGDAGGVVLHDGGHNRLVDVPLDGRCIGSATAHRLTNERWDVITDIPHHCGGITLEDSDHVTIRDSSYDGVYLDAASTFNRIVDNDLTNLINAFESISLGGSRNIVARNVLDGAVVSGDRNVLEGDTSPTTSSFATRTIAVSGTGNVLRRNEVDASPTDGFDVTAPGNFLRANRAFDNAQLGIDAVEGTIDLGGNRASGNGDSRQCAGVSCRP